MNQGNKKMHLFYNEIKKMSKESETAGFTYIENNRLLSIYC